MSWNVGYESKAAFEMDLRNMGSCLTGCEDQFAEARAAAEAIIASKCIGDESRDFVVNLYGHSNPGHAPTAGWANDCVTVSVSQKTASVAPGQEPVNRAA